MALPAQPANFADFSGGITENYLQADPTRYERADNYLVNAAKELVERDGLLAYNLLGGSTLNFVRRVNSFFNFINETILMPNSGRDIFYENIYNNWQRIEGIDGNQALQGGDENSQVSYAEFQRQIYLTSDGDSTQHGILPSKIYRNESNTWVARTVGLPRVYAPANYSDGTLLDKCISVANDIRTSMINHMGDAIVTVFNNLTTTTLTSNIKLHTFTDKFSLSYLVTQSFVATDPETPSPIPTAAPAATNQATLFTLVAALNNAYTHHMLDSTRATLQNSNAVAKNWGYTGAYHYASFGRNVGPAALLSNNATPDTLSEAAAMLDDLYQKWNFHRKAINTHSPNNDPAQFDKYQLTTTKVGDIFLEKTTPTVTPDWGDIYAYVNNLRFLLNQHVSNAYYTFGLGAHKRVDLGSVVILPEATTLDDAYLLIYWIRTKYYEHQLDGAPGSTGISVSNFATNVTFTGTLNSPTVTSVVRTDTGGPGTLSGYLQTTQGNVAPRANQYDNFGAYSTANVSSAAAGSAGLDRAILTTGALQPGQMSSSQFHSAYDTTGALVTSLNSPDLATSVLTTPAYTVGVDVDTWMDLATEFFFAWQAHATNYLIHSTNSQSAYTYYFTGRPQSGLVGVPYPNFIIPTVSNFGYAFLFSNEYTVEPNGIDYLVAGNPTFSSPIVAATSWAVGSVPPNQDLYLSNTNPLLSMLPFQTVTTRSNVITGLPVLVNTNSTNYDLANIKLQIYRTTDGGATYYLLGEVTNGTTTYIDSVNDTVANPGDTALNSRQIIYTSGGVQGNDQPPVCKYIHILQGVTYYGAITDTDQYFPQRIVQSVALAPDAAPAGNFLDLDDDLTGLTSTRSNLIALCKGSVVRVSGGFNTLGQGALIGEKISDAMGGLNEKSIVRTEIGVFFAGTDGFYYTDGFQLIKISLDLDDTYAALTAGPSQKRSIYGAYDKLSRRIHWAMKRNEADSDNSVTYVFHLNYGIKPSGCFTTASNGTNYRPSSLVFKEGVMYMGHNLGAILKDAWYQKWDSKVTSLGVVDRQDRLYIPYWYRSAAVDMGSTFQRKWLTKVHMIGQNVGNTMMTVYALKDLNQTQAGPKAMAEVNYKVNGRWGDARCVWGTSSALWEYDGKLDAWRRFPATTLRSDFMQVDFKPAYGCVYSSSDDFPEFCYATINKTTKVVSIITPTGYSTIIWPADIKNYEFKFEIDGYVQTYPVTVIGFANSVTVSDPSNLLIDIAAPGVKWELWGYKKEQRSTISSFVLHFAYLGDKNQKYPGSKTGSGDGNSGQNPT